MSTRENIRLIARAPFKLVSILTDQSSNFRIFGCCQAHRCLSVESLLLRYSVVCTVESLFLLYLPFYISIYMF